MSRQKLFDLALRGFLLLSPIFYFKHFQPSAARGMFLIVGTFVLFGISLALEPKRRFSNNWISLFFILALARAFMDGGGNEMEEWFNFWMSFASFIYIFCGVLLFYLIYSYADNPRRYLGAIVCVCMMNLVLVLAQLLGKDFMWARTGSASGSAICGFMELPAQLGQYSALALPVMFCIHPALISLPLITLLISKSVTPIMACFTGACFLACYWRHRLGKIMVLLMLTVILAWGIVNWSYITAKFYPRPIMWHRTARVIMQRPYIGWGYRTFRFEVVSPDLIQTLGCKDSPRPHSDYLHTAQELGLPILAAVGMFFVGLFKRFNLAKNKDRLLLCLATSVVIALVNMAGQSFIRYASVSGTFVVLLAFFCIKLEEVQNA